MKLMKMSHTFFCFLIVILCIMPSYSRKSRILTSCSKSICGGIAGFQCCKGYACMRISDSGNNYPDQAGKCYPIPDYPFCDQARCGGIRNFKCCEGYICHRFNEYPESDGVCNKSDIADPCDGKSCGGIAGISCCNGFECVITENIADAAGICRRKGANLF